MVSFFRRKKPQDAPPAPADNRFSAEDLAAAFPQVPASAGPVPAEDGPPAGATLQVDATATAAAPAEAATQAAAIGTPTAGAAGDAAAADTTPGTLPAAAPGKPGWRERLRNSTFARSFGGLFSRNPKLDDDLLDEIETALLTADVGVAATTVLVEGLRKRMKAREFADAQALLAALRAELVAMLAPVAQPLVIDRNARPFVLLTVGVNGVGKTTTIGKLARPSRMKAVA